MDKTLTVLLIVFSLTALWVLRYRKPFFFEVFADKTDTNAIVPYNEDIVGRQDSLSEVLDKTTKIKYEKAYYYELTNKDMLNALKKSFNLPSALAATKNINDVKWKVVDSESSEVSEMYAAIIDHFKAVLNSHGNLFTLPDGSSPPFQIVYDRLQVAMKQEHGTTDTGSKSKQAIQAIPPYLFKFDAVIYREAKVHGKHLFITCIRTKDTVSYQQIKIIGIVSSDNIGFFPVQATDNTTSLDYERLPSTKS